MYCNFTLFKKGLKDLFFIIILLNGTVYAQSFIKGHVFDKNDGNGLSNVSVLNINRNTGTVSNDSGLFSVLGSPGDVIEFSKTGYEVQSITVISSDEVLTVNLTISDNPLDEVVVSASKSNQSLKNTSVSMEVIKPYIIDNKTPLTAENTIDQIPGVQAINGQVVIRSGSGWSYGAGSRVMVMVDGMPLASGDAGQVQWSFVPIENVESIEVIKGASSVLFGSSALNGVINVRTALPGPEPITKVSVFYGQYAKPANAGLDWNNGKILNTYGIRAFHSQKKGKNALTLSLNGLNDAGYRMSDKDQRIRLGANYRRDIKKFKGYFSLNGNIQTGRSSSFLLWENNELAYTSLDSGLTENKTFRLNIDPSIVLYKKGWKHLIQTRYLRVSNDVEQVSTGEIQSNYSDFLFGEYQVSKRLWYGIQFIAGLTGNYAKSISPLYQGHQSSNNQAVYFQLNQLYRKWNFDAGVRYERYALNDYKESKPVIRAGLSRALAKFTFFRASFGQGYRFPTIAESYISTIVGPIKIYPNPELRSEQGWNAEVGVKQGLKIGKMNAILDVALFTMKYNRMMEFTFGIWGNPLNNEVGFKSLNVSDALINGIDISFVGSRKGELGELKWLCGYTFAKAISTEPDKVFFVDSFGRELTFKNTSSNPDGNYLKYRPKHLVRIDFQYDIKEWESGISLRYNSALVNIDKAFVSFPIDAAVPGIQKVRDDGKNGDYVIDLRLGRNFKKLKVLLMVNNLLNRVYMTRPSDMRPPRSIMLQLNKTF